MKFKITTKEVEGLAAWKSCNLNPHLQRVPDFYLESSIEGYTYETEWVKPILVKRKSMIDSALNLIDNPFQTGVWFCTSSLDDARANLFASYLFRRAKFLYGTKSHLVPHMKQPPKWYTSVNSWGSDIVKSVHEDNPCFAVLSNLDKDSTAQKLDRARDFIESSRSTLIVTASGVTPLQLLYDVLRRQPDDGINFSYPEITKQVDI
jgi:hypothetical protein